MSGSESSVPASAAASADTPGLLSFSVHSLPSPHAAAGDSERTRRGRRQMLVVLLVCAAPVIASYLAYYFGVLRPEGHTNYGDLIVPPRPLPAALALTDLQGRPVAASGLRGQWLIVVVAGGACDAPCERHLWLQRQLHETLGRDKERVDKLWLVDDATAPRAETLGAIGAADSRIAGAGMAPATVLRVEKPALAAWLQPASGRALEDHLYVVDPRGDWMLRVPAEADPAKLKRDVEKLLRASAGWDRAGR
jgi:cytochrome oxidase Cu insertion factor (SCO1/SenC/PrrC family)